jgi:phthiocerol/phenolphthiocerol synthesis type-I polyketide synthase E
MPQNTAYTEAEVTHNTPVRSQHLLVLSAISQVALDDATAHLAAHLRQHPELDIADVAYTLQVGWSVNNHRRFVVCQDCADALDKLETLGVKHIRGVNNSTHDRPVAFLFPGLGEQYVELARDLYRDEPDFRETVKYCCVFLKAHLNLDLHEVFSPANRVDSDTLKTASQPALDFRAFVKRSGYDASSSFAQPAVAHPATFVLEYALAQLFRQWGILPAAMLGYSLGEYVAASLSGVLSLEDALVLVAERARLIQVAPRGAMLAVNLAEKDVRSSLSDQVSLAAVNGPATCVLAGPEEPIDHLYQHFTSREIACYRVATMHAFHTPMLASLSEAVTGLVRNIKLSPPQVPYISNVTGTWISTEQATDPGYWARHMCQTVYFADGVQQLLRDSERFVLEVGPGRSLSSFVKQHPACGMARMSLVQATLPATHERQSCQSFLLNALGKLWQSGVAIDWKGFHAHEQRQHVALPI